MAGMCLAVRAAAQGHTVTLLEAHDEPGGQARPHHLLGATWDLGPTWVTLPAPFRDLFLSTGRPLEDYVELTDADEAATFHWLDGRVLALPGVGVARTTRAITDALGQAAGGQWRDLLDVGNRVWGAAHASSVPRISARTALRIVTNPALRQVVTWRTAPWSTLGSAVLPYLDATFGVHHVRGGIHCLATAVAQRCHELGVQVRTGTRVTAITGVTRVEGITLAGGEHVACDIAVRTGPARQRPTFTVAGAGLLRPSSARHTVWLAGDTEVYTHVPELGLADGADVRWMLRSRDAGAVNVLREMWGINLQADVVMAAMAGDKPTWPKRRAIRGVVDLPTDASPALALAAMAAHRVAVAIGPA